MLLSYTMTSVLSVRVSDEERALLEAASEQARTNLSDYVRRQALVAAEIAVMDRRAVTIPAKDWETFETWARRPGKKNAALAALASHKPRWKK